MVKRERYLQRIRPFYDSEMVKVITGIRRCGKSTLMQQIIAEIQQRNVADDHIIYINFENYKFRKISNPDALYEYVENKIRDNKKYYLFIDEIQNVPEFELVINSFRATHSISIFITGSNSKLLSGELATHLSGRTLSFRIMPFCFKEFVAFYEEKGEHIPSEQLLDSYMLWGGFPLTCKEENDSEKEVLLSNIYDSVVLKDVVMRNKIASVTALDRVLEYVIANSSLTISGNTIASSLKADDINVSVPTVYDYLKYISDACICDKVPRYDIRGKKVLSFEEKIYLQAAYLLNNDETVEREFGAYRSIEDNYPKYVISTDRIPMSRDGIIHKNLCNWLLESV